MQGENGITAGWISSTADYVYFVLNRPFVCADLPYSGKTAYRVGITRIPLATWGTQSTVWTSKDQACNYNQGRISRVLYRHRNDSVVIIGPERQTEDPTVYTNLQEFPLVVDFSLGWPPTITIMQVPTDTYSIGDGSSPYPIARTIGAYCDPIDGQSVYFIVFYKFDRKSLYGLSIIRGNITQGLGGNGWFNGVTAPVAALTLPASVSAAFISHPTAANIGYVILEGLGGYLIAKELKLPSLTVLRTKEFYVGRAPVMPASPSAIDPLGAGIFYGSDWASISRLDISSFSLDTNKQFISARTSTDRSSAANGLFTGGSLTIQGMAYDQESKFGLLCFDSAQISVVKLLDCPPGTDGQGQGVCAKCPPGTSSVSYNSPCLSCTAGTFNPNFGEAACKPCPNGTYSAAGQAYCAPCQSCGIASTSALSSTQSSMISSYLNATTTSNVQVTDASSLIVDVTSSRATADRILVLEITAGTLFVFSLFSLVSWKLNSRVWTAFDNCDVFFGKNHHVPEGGVVRNTKTALGGYFSICAMILVGERSFCHVSC
ncbi:hypothetical protein M427DRAFT_286459 [Gonapodya prolifera JEL478]|uniref:Tyrosine-protein kinase ephrin type A/B receptor-like domain-containing protein n=1 Tax=Gonapodya prolifera (strain JEL478) TaxID=1344416 RepID=A0A139AJ84_GONPJ|nr:hypothetical protein M427DRAFT_286459 [Gonapodya prolifera JEL478]|eukprot:KXS16856.1 hypothetical protein M427DRAFT_286459 [Gonapodya prolifera JEL478]